MQEDVNIDKSIYDNILNEEHIINDSHLTLVLQ